MVKGIKYAPLPTPPSAPSKRMLYFTKEVFFFGGSQRQHVLVTSSDLNWHLHSSSLAIDPCRNYGILDGFDRSVTNKDQTNLRCDQKDLSPLPAWYRFTGAAGDRMPTSCVEPNSCGTDAPGWLDGLHPSVKEGIVTRRVCYRLKSKCCYQKNDIQIQNCGTFYIYRLVKPPECDLRYCGNNTGELLTFGLAPREEIYQIREGVFHLIS